MLASDQVDSQLKEHSTISATLAARQQYLNNIFSMQHGQHYVLLTHRNVVNVGRSLLGTNLLLSSQPWLYCDLFAHMVNQLQQTSGVSLNVICV